MISLAIYDLDRTITRHSTFTPFMIHAAWKDAKLRLATLPLWLLAALGHRLKLYGRKPLKQFGLALLVGRRLSPERAERLAQRFADWFVSGQLLPGALESIVNDRAAGRRLVLATAAPEIYARELGRRLGMDDVIATRHVREQDGTIRSAIIGENCYGEEKLLRVQAWLDGEGLARENCLIRAYSDHLSDAPLLDFADEPVLVVRRLASTALARRHGWQSADFRHIWAKSAQRLAKATPA